VIWRGKNIIVDGVHRYQICQKHGIKFPKLFMDFSSRAEVIQWIIDNQFGRRNLSDATKAKLRQARIERVAKLRAEGQSQRAIAEQVGVSQKQVRRDLAASPESHVSPGPPNTIGGIKGRDGKLYPARQSKLIPELAGMSLSPKFKLLIEALLVGKQKDMARLLAQGHAIRKAYEKVMDQREPGDEDDGKSKGRPKPGKVIYNWKPYKQAFGVLARDIDDLAEAFGIENICADLRESLKGYDHAHKAAFENAAHQKAPENC
jgi:hypothetical protein